MPGPAAALPQFYRSCRTCAPSKAQNTVARHAARNETLWPSMPPGTRGMVCARMLWAVSRPAQQLGPGTNAVVRVQTLRPLKPPSCAVTNIVARQALSLTLRTPIIIQRSHQTGKEGEERAHRQTNRKERSGDCVDERQSQYTARSRGRVICVCGFAVKSNSPTSASGESRDGVGGGGGRRRMIPCHWEGGDPFLVARSVTQAIPFEE